MNSSYEQDRWAATGRLLRSDPPSEISDAHRRLLSSEPIDERVVKHRTLRVISPRVVSQRQPDHLGGPAPTSTAFNALISAYSQSPYCPSALDNHTSPSAGTLRNATCVRTELACLVRLSWCVTTGAVRSNTQIWWATRHRTFGGVLRSSASVL
jgi:hypothetical protein